MTLIPYFYVTNALSYDDSAFTLSWTTVTNAIVLDVDKNGYADNVYSYSTSGQNITLTKILGSGVSSGIVTMPFTSTLSTLNSDKDLIFVGSGLVQTTNCTTSLGTFNITSGTVNNSVLSQNVNGSSGTNAIKFVIGMLGVSNEPVLHSSCESATVFPTDYTVKNSSSLILQKRDNDAFKIREEGEARDVIFSSNGTKMYIIGEGTDSIYQYTLSTAFLVSTAVYDNVSFSVSGQELVANALRFNSDGTKLFVLGSNSDTVFQYSLSNPYMISSASYGGVSKLISAQSLIPTGLTFSTNGTKMYVLDQGASVFQYNLTSSFNVNTATYDTVTFNAVGCDNVLTGLDINSDGSKMYLSGNGGADFLCEYTLSNPYQISSSASLSTFSIGGQDATNQDVTIIDSGNHIVSLGSTNDRVHNYIMTTPYTLSTATFKIGNSGAGYNGLMTYANIEQGYAVDTNSIIDNQFTLPTNVNTGLCGNTGCLTNSSDVGTEIKASPILGSSGAYISPSIKLFNAGLEMPHSTVIGNSEYLPLKNDYWYSYLPTLTSNSEDILKMLHLKILNSALTTDPYRLIFDDGTNKYLMYVSGSNILYSAINSSTLSGRSFGFYYPDAVIDLFDTTFTNVTLASNSYDLVTPTSTITFTNSGIVSILSGYELQTASTVVRAINSEVNNNTSIVPYIIGSSSSQVQLSMIIRNAPSIGAISIQDENNKLLTSYYQWSQDYIKADDTFDVDLPYPKCVDVYLKDLSYNGSSWEFLGNLCNTGVMPKTIVYSSNLSFTFWSLDYGVSHTFDQPTTGLTTMLRHDTYPYNYTVRIYDADNVLAYENEFQSLTELDNQSINATGIDLPALLRVYDDNGNQLYYATIGTPSYLSSDFAWFSEWFTIEGFNLLFMLPLIFGAMFTRNTVGVGTMITVAFIATLTWLGVIPVPDLVIYLMIFISIVGVIAYKKLYD